MRPVVSYDDITLPYDETPLHHRPHLPGPPVKKSKQNNHTTKPPAQQESLGNMRHSGVNSKSNTGGGEEYPDHAVRFDFEEEEGEADRRLTYDEIWDDSALIDAWNAAMEEYEAYNGPDKGWKTEPVNTSPLWYNIPPTISGNASEAKSRVNVALPSIMAQSQNSGDDNSQPLNFDTFVPSHDPSLELPSLSHPPSVHEPGYKARRVSMPSNHFVSQDDAFRRASGAMYWAGYWTAVYHCHRSLIHEQAKSDEQDCEEDEAEGRPAEEEEPAPAQR